MPVVTANSVEEYLRSRKLSENTRSKYRSTLLTFLKWSREHSFYTLSTAARYFEADLKRTGRVTAHTAETYGSTVRAFVTWLAENKGAGNFNISAETLIRRGAFPSLPKRIADEDVAFICRVTKGRDEGGLRDRALFLLAVTCGLTPQQIACITPRDAEFDDTSLWLEIPCEDAGKARVEAAPAARDALREYLVARGSVDESLPLIAVTTPKGSRKAMGANGVRKRIAGMLGFLGYDYADVLHGDPERTVATYLPLLSEDKKREVARLATRLHYEGLSVDETRGPS